MRLIDADALIQLLRTCADDDWNKNTPAGTWSSAYEEMILHVEDAPTIERKKGKWIWLSSTYDRIPCEMRYMCSECHHETILHSNGTSYPWENFCPNCGADMRGEQS